MPECYVISRGYQLECDKALHREGGRKVVKVFKGR